MHIIPGKCGAREAAMEKLEHLLADMLEYQKGCGLSVKTINRNKYLLHKFFRWLGDKDIREVDRPLIYQYAKHLKTKKKRSTGKPITAGSVALNMCIVKGFFDYLIRHEKILVNPMEGLRFKGKGKYKMRKIFSEEDIALFLDSIGIDGAERQRDRAIFELIYSSGLRVSDIRNLEVEHLNINDRVLLVKGKGEKEAYIPFSEAAQQFMVKYLNSGRKWLIKHVYKGKDERYVFICKKGKLNLGRLYERFQKYLKDCGLEKKGYTIHSIRHATGTHLLARGVSIRFVQELLRHADLKTTQLYTRPTIENIKAVYMTYHPRCNEYHREVTGEYLEQVRALKERLIWGRQASKQYKKEGHKRGVGRWKGSINK
jgi:integrase/recombinase XerD